MNADNVVEQVIVAEQDFIDTLPDKDSWIQTSYNTHAGEHPEGRPLRKNYAGIGYLYCPDRDAFMPPKPFESWKLNEDTCLWEAPVPYPENSEEFFGWDEEQQEWISPPSVAEKADGGTSE